MSAAGGPFLADLGRITASVVAIPGAGAVELCENPAEEIGRLGSVTSKIGGRCVWNDLRRSSIAAAFGLC
jgi:hypothetical protein